MKVALVHDWLTGMRGGEKVLELLLDLYPGAPLYTLLHVPGSVSESIESHAIHSSFVQKLPQAARRYRHYLPLFPFAIERLDLGGYDFVLSSSHCVAKGVRIARRARHLCYCHTPMRYAWDQYDAYFGERRGVMGRFILPAAMARLRRWDRASAGRVHHYVANSRNVQAKIQRYWDVPAHRSSVQHPPVDSEFYTPDPGGRRGDYYLIVSAMVPYKRLDLAVEAFRGGERELIIAGGGPDEQRLRALAGSDARIRFLSSPDDERLRELYRNARAFIMPGEEDFGITALEAQACGTPVIALGRGGALESVIDGETGLFFAEPRTSSLREALRRFEAGRFDPARLRSHAEGFSKASFKAGMKTQIERFLAGESVGEAAAFAAGGGRDA